MEVWRASFQAAGCVLVPGAITLDAAAALRARVDSDDFDDYWLADRGRYRVNRRLIEPALFADLQLLAEAIAGVELALGAFTWSRHARGDYALLKDDALAAPAPVELTLDLSAAASDYGQTVWFSPGASLTLPQSPGTLALVDRRRLKRRYERYLSHRAGDAIVHRLRLSFSV